MESDDEAVTESDVVELNRAAVERSASIARLAGSVLVAVGAIGIAGWAWLAFHTQDHADPIQFGFDEEVTSRTASMSERIDLFSASLSLLMISTLVTAVGLFVRFAGDYGRGPRVGGSVTGFQPGDRFGSDAP